MFSDDDFVSHLVARFSPRVVVLYGSAARGQARSDSDIDVVCFCEPADRYPVSYLWRGLLVDAWIHPLADVEKPAEFLKLYDGRILRDHESLGQNLLARVTNFLAQPREKLGVRHERHRRAWVWKMFGRAAESGVGADYRRHWLLFDLPETWCDLTGRHYLGADNALATMKREANAVYEAVVRALAMDSSISDVELAVAAVVGAQDDCLLNEPDPQRD